MPRILKSPPSADTSLAPFAFDDLGQHARTQLDEARREAARIIAAADCEASEIRLRAEEQGRLAGQAVAERESAERLDRELHALTPALRAAVTALQEAKAAWLMHWEQSAVKLAAAIAARVIRREVSRTPEITLSLVREALELAAGSADVQLRMRPDDAEALGPQIQLLIAEVGRMGCVSLVADPTITTGGCRIDTRHGTIDQQFEAQLARIAQELA